MHAGQGMIDVPHLIHHLASLVVRAADVVLIALEVATDHQRLASPRGELTIAVELHPGVDGLVASLCNGSKEVVLYLVSGVAHVGITHHDGGTLVLLELCEHIVAQLAQLGYLYGFEGGRVVIAPGIHVSDIDIYIYPIGHSDHIMAEALLDAGVGSVGKSTYLGCILNHSLASGAQPLLPEEAQTVGIGTLAEVEYTKRTAILACIVVAHGCCKLCVVLKVLTHCQEIPSQRVGLVAQGYSALLAWTIAVDG